MVTITPEHPFSVQAQADTQPRPKPVGHEELNTRWVGAGHLQIGDKIRQADGGVGVVANVVTIQQTQEMFNLTVDEAHTFYVGERGWLVHNCDPVIDPNKFKYLFGEVTSNAHNAARSNQLALEMKRLGLRGSPNDIAMLTEHLTEAVSIESNIISKYTTQYGNFEIRQSLFFGPSGKATLFESSWQVLEDGARRFSSVIPKRGK